MTAILRLCLRYISRRLFQSAMCALGVALGVGVVIAIDIANESASRAFRLSSESLVGRATHQIIGGPNGFDSAFYATLRLELGIKAQRAGRQRIRARGRQPPSAAPAGH